MLFHGRFKDKLLEVQLKIKLCIKLIIIRGAVEQLFYILNRAVPGSNPASVRKLKLHLILTGPNKQAEWIYST